MHKSCKFQIKDGIFIPSLPAENYEPIILYSYHQEYNLINDNSQLIVKTEISIKFGQLPSQKITHKTLVELLSFTHKPSDMNDAVDALMWNLRHNLFDKIKLELKLTSGDILKEYFPNDSQFICKLNKDLKFDNYDFTPILNLNTLHGVGY